MASSGRLTTHVLDTSSGKPAAGLRIELFRIHAESRESLAAQMTNDDGRTDKPMLAGDDFTPGDYELVFNVGDYFRRSGLQSEAFPFLNVVPVRFGLADADAHYHVPLLVAPFAYSTYRGS